MTLVNQLYVLIGTYVLTAVIWSLAALFAYQGYRAFRQDVDLGWAGAFVLLGALRLGLAWEAYGWRLSLNVLSGSMLQVLNDTSFLRIRYSALELVAAFMILYLFRSPRRMH